VKKMNVKAFGANAGDQPLQAMDITRRAPGAHDVQIDIVNTVAAPHSLDAFLILLKRDGTMTLVGAPASPHPSPEVCCWQRPRQRMSRHGQRAIPPARSCK
jgi:D-arabinose 1-dehydrogenase-like Zn-dependent alcohol dehydrogenase